MRFGLKRSNDADLDDDLDDEPEDERSRPRDRGESALGAELSEGSEALIANSGCVGSVAAIKPRGLARC